MPSPKRRVIIAGYPLRWGRGCAARPTGSAGRASPGSGRGRQPGRALARMRRRGPERGGSRGAPWRLPGARYRQRRTCHSATALAEHQRQRDQRSHRAEPEQGPRVLPSRAHAKRRHAAVRPGARGGSGILPCRRRLALRQPGEGGQHRSQSGIGVGQPVLDGLQRLLLTLAETHRRHPHSRPRLRVLRADYRRA